MGSRSGMKFGGPLLAILAQLPDFRQPKGRHKAFPLSDNLSKAKAQAC
jgi:hypothetical protein